MFKEEQQSFDKIHRLLKNVPAKNQILEVFLQLDFDTRTHCYRVSRLARSISHILNLENDYKDIIELAAFLHDIGKIAISKDILLKPASLTKNELKHVQLHPEIGAQIVHHFALDSKIVHAIRSHHEFFNGMGYPYGIAGSSIPLSSRIISIADAVDAMVSKRHYSASKPLKQAIQTIIHSSGSQFDPSLVTSIIRNSDFVRMKTTEPKMQASH